MSGRIGLIEDLPFHGEMLYSKGAHATRDIERVEPVATYGKGRTCRRPGCDTLLSAFNPTEFCGLHKDHQYDNRTVAMDYDTTGDRRCAVCGALYPPWMKYWFADTHAKDGLAAACKFCERPGLREEENAKAKKRAERQHARKLAARRDAA